MASLEIQQEAKEAKAGDITPVDISDEIRGIFEASGSVSSKIASSLKAKGISNPQSLQELEQFIGSSGK